MGKKTNPYSEFVKAEYDSAKKADPKSCKNMAQLFSDPAISLKWTNSSELVRQKYKNIAAAKNNGTYSRQNDYSEPTPRRSNFTKPAASFTNPTYSHSFAKSSSFSNPASSTKQREGHRPVEQISCKELIFSKSPSEILNSTLYSISCNVMCSDTEERSYIPLEISIYSYNLTRGEVTPPFLVFINPGEPPVGKMAQAKQHLEQTKHAIPFAPHAPFLPCARSDYRQIYREIRDYVGGNNQKVLLVQEPEYVEQIRGVLKWLDKKAVHHQRPNIIHLPSEDPWLIYDIAEYAALLAERLESPLPDSICIDMLLDNINTAYSNNLNCHWHSLTENETKWCAKSCAIRSIINLENLFEWFKNTYEKKQRS